MSDPAALLSRLGLWLALYLRLLGLGARAPLARTVARVESDTAQLIRLTLADMQIAAPDLDDAALVAWYVGRSKPALSPLLPLRQRFPRKQSVGCIRAKPVKRRLRVRIRWRLAGFALMHPTARAPPDHPYSDAPLRRLRRHLPRPPRKARQQIEARLCRAGGVAQRAEGGGK